VAERFPVESYKVEGIGYDFIPDVLDRDLVDRWIKSRDRESFLMARRLIRQEGLLCGGSSGAAAWAAVELAKEIGPEKRIVTILPDSVRNYMTKFLDDRWMAEHGFSERLWETGTVGDILRSLPERKPITARVVDSVADAVKRMKERGVSQLPVVEGGKLVGILGETDILARLVEGRATLESKVADAMLCDVRTVHETDDAGDLTALFAEGLIGIVVDDENRLQGIVTHLDLVDYLTSRPG